MAFKRYARWGQAGGELYLIKAFTVTGFLIANRTCSMQHMPSTIRQGIIYYLMTHKTSNIIISLFAQCPSQHNPLPVCTNVITFNACYAIHNVGDDKTNTTCCLKSKCKLSISSSSTKIAKLLLKIYIHTHF